MKILPERLRELREQNGLSMLALAEKIGVSDAAICKWENATNEPKASYIALLAEFFEVSTDYLLGLENDVGLKKYSAPKSKTAALSPDGQELLDMFSALDADYKAQILEYTRYFYERTKGANYGRKQR